MTVTEITDVSKSRKRITLDEGQSFVLYAGELRTYQLKEGGEISKESLCEIMETVLPKRAKLRAMNLLKARAYTEKQLTDKLKSGGYPTEVIDSAVAYVASYGYLNDRQYAADYIEYRKEYKTKTAICSALMQKGISKELIDEVWEENAGEEAQILERNQILAWAEKKHFEPEKASFEEKQKFMAFLYRKGFKFETIRSVLSLDITSI